MSSQSSSSSYLATKVPERTATAIIEAFGCILSDADSVLEKLERRYRLIDVEKLSAYVHVLADYVDALASLDSKNLDIPLVDDQSSVVDDSEEEDDLLDEEDEC